jgi:hypothetical protein
VREGKKKRKKRKKDEKNWYNVWSRALLGVEAPLDILLLNK